MYQIVVDKSVKKKGEKSNVDDLEVKEFTLISFVLDYVKDNAEKGHRIFILKK